MKIINIAARWLTSGLAVWAGFQVIVIGLLVSTMGGLSRSLPVLAVAFIFLGPALFTLFGGTMKLIRGLWIVTAALSLAGIFLYPQAKQGAEPMLIYALLGLAISFGARDKKSDEDLQAEAS